MLRRDLPEWQRCLVSDDGARNENTQPAKGSPAPFRGERRWPMALSVVTAIALLAALPGEVRPGPRWLLAFMGLILVALIVADPGRIDGSTTIERVLSIALLALLIMSSAVATVLLVRELIVGGGITDSAVRLLLVATPCDHQQPRLGRTPREGTQGRVSAQ